MFNKNKKSKILFITFFFVGCLFSASLLKAENTKNSEEKTAFRFSFIHRTRFVSWDNAIHLDKTKKSDSTFTRHRTSIALSWQPHLNWEFNLKLTNEFRIYFIPSDREFSLNELFVDNLTAIWKKPGGLPLIFTLGRQNIMLGEGFVVMDGHPLDGSRSIYFNAARLDMNIKEGHNLIFFYAYQPEKDTWLPVINSQDQALIEQPEEGITLYYTGKFRNMDLDTYFIRKNIRRAGSSSVGSGINTFGFRPSYSLNDNLQLTGEAAIQTGTYGEFGRMAFGGYVHLDYSLRGKPPIPSVMTIGGICLSGDDPQTPDMEGWDPLFSRWPKWSESYIYTLIPEYAGKVAFWSNLASLYGSIRYNIGRPAALDLFYYHLIAPRASLPTLGFPGGSGKNRGDLFISKLNLALAKGLTGHILWEVFFPGSYYRPGADSYSWFRLELMYRWEGECL
ncbi:MAG: hypothetical protein JXB26_19415 [Candidatus Aminicenantes bacterium]|nr:hypothetical protein [Candidatus Aminicenantes bacterium]